MIPRFEPSIAHRTIWLSRAKSGAFWSVQGINKASISRTDRFPDRHSGHLARQAATGSSLADLASGFFGEALGATPLTCSATAELGGVNRAPHSGPSSAPLPHFGMRPSSTGCRVRRPRRVMRLLLLQSKAGARLALISTTAVRPKRTPRAARPACQDHRKRCVPR